MDADITAPDAILYLNDYLKNAVQVQCDIDGVTFDDATLPASALLLYSVARQEIWSVADSPFMIDGVLYEYPLKQEPIWANMRALCLRAEMIHGKTVDDLQKHDPTWDVLMDLIKRTRVFANYDGEYGFGVLTGQSIPACHIRVTDASGASDIVMASDGYLKIEPTWADTEKYLQDVIAKDPLMIDIHPQAKGVKAGNISFDDRSYVRIKVIPA